MTMRSKARAIDAVVAVTRSRRLPSAGMSTRSSRPRYRPGFPRRTPTTKAGTSPSTASIAGPRGRVAGAPKSVTGVPPPVRSRSPTSPTLVPSRRAASRARRASRRPTMRTPTAPRVRTNQACSAGSSMVSIGATAPPSRTARNRAGSSIAPKCRPMNTTGPPANAAATVSGVSIVEPLVDLVRAHGRRPGHLQVVAGGVPVGQADEALEGARVVGGAAAEGAALAVAACHVATRRRLRRAWAARSGVARYHRSPANSARRTSGPSGRWQASHEAPMRAWARARGTSPVMGPRGRLVAAGMSTVRDPACRPASAPPVAPGPRLPRRWRARSA